MARPAHAKMDRMLTLELVRVTERAAVAAARRAGAATSNRADQAAVEAMWSELNRLDVRGRIVVGEGERDAAPKLYVGEEVGTGEGAGGRYRRSIRSTAARSAPRTCRTRLPRSLSRAAAGS